MPFPCPFQTRRLIRTQALAPEPVSCVQHLQVLDRSVVLLVSFQPTIAFFCWYCLYSFCPKPLEGERPHACDSDAAVTLAITCAANNSGALATLAAILSDQLLPAACMPPAASISSLQQAAEQPGLDMCMSFMTQLAQLAPGRSVPQQAPTAQSGTLFTDVTQPQESLGYCCTPASQNCDKASSENSQSGKAQAAATYLKALILVTQVLCLIQPITAHSTDLTHAPLLSIMTVLLNKVTRLSYAAAEAIGRTPCDDNGREAMWLYDVVMQLAMRLFHLVVQQHPDPYHMWNVLLVTERLLSASLQGSAQASLATFCKQGAARSAS